MSWADVVTLDERWRSLPSGVLQEWPLGMHMTLETLAGAMISISDNTAADALATQVGRDEVERSVPARARPFLTTREAFVLKAPVKPRCSRAGARRAWRGVVRCSRRSTLGRCRPGGIRRARPIWTSSGTSRRASSARSCPRSRTCPLMTINPGIGRMAPGDRIAYKGGSEPGVVNLTVAVQRGARHVCVSATWNDVHEVDTLKLVVATRGLAAALLR
jgi:hypothetical protein